MSEKRARKDALFEAIALMGKGFASPVRLERRARAAPRRTAGGSRGDRVLPRTVLRVRPRGGPDAQALGSRSPASRRGLAGMEARPGGNDRQRNGDESSMSTTTELPT